VFLDLATVLSECIVDLVKSPQLIIMKNSVLWDIMPCSPSKVNRRFGGTCRSKNKPSKKPAWKQVLAWLILLPWRWRRHFSPKCWLSTYCRTLYRRR
jgi:hypothetical protein